jgi:hypothetical protein
MSDPPYVTDDSRDDPLESEGDPDDNSDDLLDLDSDARDQEGLDQYFDKLEAERGTDDSDAYVCETWDQPNYISADHDHFSSLSRWQPDPDTSLDAEKVSDKSPSRQKNSTSVTLIFF